MGTPAPPAARRLAAAGGPAQASAVAVDVSDIPTVDGVASQTGAERRIIEVERKRLGLDDQPGPSLAAVT